jgi:Secretion system C-terminal sorting domain
MKFTGFLFLLFWVAFAPTIVFAQCAHDPRVTGDTLLCPNATGVLTTQAADAYQWNSRPFGGITISPVSGATSQSLPIGPNDLLFYFSVDVTLAGCTEQSPEVLVDGWLFLLPYVSSTGDFMIGGNGESIICVGDTMYFTMGAPYDTLITWYLNGNPIPGNDSTTLIVTQAGTYTAQGAPRICPTYLQPLGVNLVVLDTVCNVSVIDPLALGMLLFPNPARGHVQVHLEDEWTNCTIVDATGREVWAATASQKSIVIDVSGWASGTYLVKCQLESGGWIHAKLLVE